MSATNGAVRNGLEGLLLQSRQVIEPSRVNRPTDICERQLLSNADGGEPRSLPAITSGTIELLGGWPKAVSGILQVPVDGHRLRPLGTTVELFAHLGHCADIDWRKGSRFTTKDEFHAHLRNHCEQYEALELFPHNRQLPGVLYHHPPLPDVQHGLLDELLDFFSPASSSDAILLRAFTCSLFWAGSPGARPTFIFGNATHSGRAGSLGTDSGRGISKSTVVAVLSSLCGGFIDIGSDTDIDRLATRLLSSGAVGKRLVRMDNVKSERFASAGFERVTTASIISGHRLYLGEGCRPNYFTYAVTMNGVCVGTDMSSRSVVIELARPSVYRATWQREVTQFIEEHRWELIAEIVDILNQPTMASLQGLGRQAEWEAEVLARLPNAQDVLQLIQHRRGEIDGDAETIRAILDGLRQRSPSYPRNVRTLSTEQMVDVVNKAYGERFAANKLKTFLERMVVPGLIHRRSNNGVFHEWTDPDQPVTSLPPEVGL